MRIYKYEATGNDFLFVTTPPDDPSNFAAHWCDRHYGIGADGLIFPVKSSVAPVAMRYYNADGSVAPMCGNGMRAFVRFLYDQRIVTAKAFSVDTLGGMIDVRMHEDFSIELGLGIPQTVLSDTLIKGGQENMSPIKLPFGDETIKMHVLNLGTIHVVHQVNDLDAIDINEYGEAFVRHTMFPSGINVNISQTLKPGKIRLKTYERGVGPTLSCGTGTAAAAYVHAISEGVHFVEASVPGGTLHVTIDNNHYVSLRGPARYIATVIEEENS